MGAWAQIAVKENVNVDEIWTRLFVSDWPDNAPSVVAVYTFSQDVANHVNTPWRESVMLVKVLTALTWVQHNYFNLLSFFPTF